MDTREKSTLIATAVLALVVLVAVRTFTDLGVVGRFVSVTVAVFVIHAVVERVLQ